tara:strand:+ start:258 stop:560 length:303 start_codon:yes stop_codon:yes gene_type:complete
LLFGDKVITRIINYQKLKVGYFIVIDISGENRIRVEVNKKYRELYIITRNSIWFLLKEHKYDLELLENELNENKIPLYDMIYTLIYVKAYHDSLNNSSIF